ncbi:MAG: glycyl radical protein [Tissierellales bacterium]|nr:glycyl radical protein [Tissierellales bacterium]MBN2827153.1 glycyl radical protein [Tissierellales bacterium]
MRGSTERVKQLREQSVNTKPALSLERAVLMTDVYEKHFGEVSIPVLRALSFKNYLEKRELYLGKDELIVGEKGVEPQVAPTFPELCCHTMEDLDVMDRRKNISFKVSEDNKRIHKDVIIPYWHNKSIRHKILTNMSKEWKACYEAGIFTEFMEQRAPGHTVADDKIYHKGFLDFKREIEQAIENLDYHNDMEALDKKNQLDAMLISCEAIIAYGKRYAEHARALAQKESDDRRKDELLWIASNCDVVPANKPKSFAQAVQMYWFVHIGVTTELNTWDAFSPGKLDQYLYPFYKKEIDEGTITYDFAKEILECLWVKFNNQPAPPKVGITLKESATYTDFANINTGGINPYTGEDGVNEVSHMILEVMDEMKLLQPSSNVQISQKTPKDFLKKALKISRKGWGQPAFYNTEELIQELIVAGKTREDAMFGGSSGCVETGAHGREAYILTGYFNLPKVLELTLSDGFDKEKGKQLGLQLMNGQEFECFEDLMDAYKAQMKHFIDIKIEGNNIIEKIFGENMPATFLSVITEDCIRNGRDYNKGGARYNTRYLQGVGIGNVADSLAAIKYNVFDYHRFTLIELIEAADHNFSGYELIHKIVSKDTPKYGNDDDYADDLMRQAFNIFYDLVTNRPTVFGGTYRIDMLPTTCHVYFGSVTRATLNGRYAYKPLPDGISPEKGADTNGPTAVIKSAAKMDHYKTGGTLLNQKFSPSAIDSEQGIENLAAFLRAYFRMGGHHLQFNVFDKEILLKAQENPDEYNNLIVRVAGYSDHFNNLEKALQDEIIDRTEQHFN